VSYLPIGAVIFDKPQRYAIELSPEELASLSKQERLEYLMRYHEVQAQKTSAFWDAVSAGVAVIVPVAAILGLERFLGGRKGKS
jgi:hypothetical protein